MDYYNHMIEKESFTVFSINPLPVHPFPKEREKLSQWLYRVSNANSIHFITLLQAIVNPSSNKMEINRRIIGFTKISTEVLTDLQYDLELIGWKKSQNFLSCPFSQCHRLNKPFKFKAKLEQHLSDVHDINVNWYCCSQCNKKFKQKHVLIQHLATIHEINLNWYTCSLCNKKFKTKMILKNHKINKHDIDVQWYHCAYCPGNFKQLNILNTHLADIHDINVKWYFCSYCDKKFKRKGFLKTHIRDIHKSIDKSYKCSICKKSYKRKGHLTDHYKSKNHRTKMNSIILKELMNEKITT